LNQTQGATLLSPFLFHLNNYFSTALDHLLDSTHCTAGVTLNRSRLNASGRDNSVSRKPLGELTLGAQQTFEQHKLN